MNTTTNTKVGTTTVVAPDLQSVDVPFVQLRFPKYLHTKVVSIVSKRAVSHAGDEDLFIEVIYEYESI